MLCMYLLILLKIAKLKNYLVLNLYSIPNQCCYKYTFMNMMNKNAKVALIYEEKLKF